MNSLLQQLYLIPEFRNGILSVEILSKENLNNDLLYQMQFLFAYLQESVKGYYNTSTFCESLQDCEGKPINTAQQMDCNEFSNMLFDKLENLLKDSPQATLLQKIFGGTLCNQLICKECPHGSERDEPFFTLSLEILRQKNIIDSLKLFTQGEMLCGDNKYFCEICNKRVDTLKRCCIKTLPNTLFLHLKRFEFDYDKMRHIKLNDSCEFPMSLDMFPYTKEGLQQLEETTNIESIIKNSNYPSSYYQYQLVGVVIHIGTADCGHYYSIIKDRSSKEEKWFEYNDTKISPFDPKQIPNYCFGGTEEIVEQDRSGNIHYIYQIINFYFKEKKN